MTASIPHSCFVFPVQRHAALGAAISMLLCTTTALATPSLDQKAQAPRTQIHAPDLVVEAMAAPSTAINQPGNLSLVGLTTYPKRGVRIANSLGPIDGISGEQVRNDTPFRIASLTKSFTAAAIFKLIEQGRFELDNPIQALLSEATEAQMRLANVDPRTITVRQLLAHRSGLQDYVGDAYATQLVANPSRKWTRAEQLAIALELGAFGADEVYLYADTNYILLGEIIERSTQTTLAASYRSLLNFSGLGLNSTYLESAETAPTGLGKPLRAYVRGFDTSLFDASFDLYGGGGLISTTKDVTQFYRALFAGRVISKASVKLMSETVSGGGFSEAAYGLGLMPFYIGNHACYGHIGFSNVIAGHCPSIDYTFVYAGGSDLIKELRLTEQGLGYQVARSLRIDTTPKPFGADFERTRCPKELLNDATSVQCGVLAVPEKRDAARGEPNRLLRFPVAVAQPLPRAGALSKTPLLLLGGGPGDALLPTFTGLFNTPEASTSLLNGQDLIAIEYRGVGAARPNLTCDTRLRSADDALQCVSKFADLQVDLSRYTSLEIAADIEQLRNSLNVERWKLLGFSYGTRQALTVLRERPHTVQAIVLDGVDPPNASFNDATDYARTLDSLFASCMRQTDCEASFPNLKLRLYNSLNELDRLPMMINGGLITGSNLVDSLAIYQGDPALLAYLPAVMDAYARKDVEFLERVIVPSLPDQAIAADPNFSDALFFSISCQGSAPFVNRSELQMQLSGNDPILRSRAKLTQDNLDICAVWPSAALTGRENQNASLSVPTLILNGEFDLQTAPSLGRALAASSSNARTLEFPAIGHIALTQSTACAALAVAEFLAAASPTNVQASCVAQLPSVRWMTAINEAFFTLIGR